MYVLKGPRHLDWLANRPEVRKLYILSLDEQHKRLNELPIHLRQMVLFQVNTGCREKEVYELQWAWERQVAALNTSVFIIPSYGEPGRLVVLNDSAKAVIEQQRDLHLTHVFAQKDNPVTQINHSVWNRVRQKIGLPQVRFYDLRLIFERGLAVAGVSLKDRQNLLEDRSTSDYSSDELFHWIRSSE